MKQVEDSYFLRHQTQCESFSELALLPHKDQMLADVVIAYTAVSSTWCEYHF